MAWLKLGTHLHASMLRRLFKSDVEEASALRQRAKQALKASDLSGAWSAAVESIGKDPVCRDGTKLLLKVKSREAKLIKNGSLEHVQTAGLHELQNRLLGLRFVSDPVIEALAIVHALAGSPSNAIDALQQLPKSKGGPVLSSRLMKILISGINDPKEFHKLSRLLDQFEIPKDTVAREAVCKGLLAHEIKFGQSVQINHPLQDPEVFSAFTKTVESGKPAVTSFSKELQDAIASGQVAPKVSNRLRAGKKLLVVSENWNFFPLVANALEAGGFEVRFMDFGVLKSAFEHSHASLDMSKQVKSLLTRPSPKQVFDELSATNPLVSELIEWSDVVFCEWFTDCSVWMSRYLPEEKSLIARVHSYEAFSTYPFFANLRRFDGLIFIAPHIQKIFTSLVGGHLLENCEIKVIPNFRDVSNLTFEPRDASAQRTLGMTQYASANKDPIFALDIFAALRAEDPSWRLKLIGEPWGDLSSEKEAHYRERFFGRLAEFGDSVFVDEFTSDIQSWYKSIGYILSTSNREGSHESLVEGMLTGAIPALRNWPMMAPFGAPSSVFPDLDYFESPSEGAEYISKAAAQFDERSSQASEYAKRFVSSQDSADELNHFIESVSVAPTNQTK